MCLSDIKKHFIAEEHLIVHKHFLEVKNGNAISSFKNFKYKCNELFSLKEKIRIVNVCDNRVEVDINNKDARIVIAFHSYLYEEQAINNDYNEEALICIIPKGSECYTGSFCYHEDSIVSNKIIITSILSKDLQFFLNNINIDNYLKENNIIL